MPDTAQELRHLEDAARLIARGEVLVAEQRRRIEELRKDGHSTQQAEQLLQSLTVALQTIREAQGLVERTLRDIEAGTLLDLDADSRASAK